MANKLVAIAVPITASIALPLKSNLGRAYSIMVWTILSYGGYPGYGRCKPAVIPKTRPAYILEAQASTPALLGLLDEEPCQEPSFVYLAVVVPANI